MSALIYRRDRYPYYSSIEMVSIWDDALDDRKGPAVSWWDCIEWGCPIGTEKEGTEIFCWGRRGEKGSAAVGGDWVNVFL